MENLITALLFTLICTKEFQTIMGDRIIFEVHMASADLLYDMTYNIILGFFFQTLDDEGEGEEEEEEEEEEMEEEGLEVNPLSIV